MPDCLAIGKRTPLLDSQTQRKNLAGNERQVCILNIAEQKLGASIDESSTHDRKVKALKRKCVDSLNRFNASTIQSPAGGR
jgi:hypothetical protein